MEIIIGCVAILMGAGALVLAIMTKEELRKKNETIAEVNEADLLDEAVDVISQYCKGQKEEGRCAFNLNETNAVCECTLLKNLPEDWHGNHKN